MRRARNCEVDDPGVGLLTARPNARLSHGSEKTSSPFDLGGAAGASGSATTGSVVTPPGSARPPGADHAVPGDGRREIVLAHPLGHLGPLRHDEVAHLARRVPHADLRIGRKLDPELAQNGSRLGDGSSSRPGLLYQVGGSPSTSQG